MSILISPATTPALEINHHEQPLRACRVLRRMRGGSQSCLIEASDGNTYVVKFLQNPQGARVCFNEALAALIGQVLDLPFPRWRPIFITDRFCSEQIGNFETSGQSPTRPQEGWHFASLLHSDSSIYEVLPQNWCRRIRNRQDFLRILIFDIWAGHTDHRQAFFAQHGDLSVTATFFDNGHVFWGPGALQDARMRSSTYLNRSVYEGLCIDGHTRETWSRMAAFSEESLQELVSRIPVSWVPQNSAEICRRLIQRSAMPRELSEVSGSCTPQPVHVSLLA